MRLFMFLPVLLLSLEASAASDSLCQLPEKALFDCAVRGKRLSLCASGDLKSPAGKVQYRFGSGEKLELAYPVEAASPVGKFWYSRTLYSGGGEFRVRFRNGDHEYLVFDRIIRRGFGPGGNNPLFESGIAVKHKGKVLAVRKCSGAARRDDDLLDQLPEEPFDDEGWP